MGGVTAPPATTNASPPVYVGPTDNLTKVANALHVSAQSLTTAVTVAGGLALTQPVTISIALGGYAPTRITQTYPPTGTVPYPISFIYSDPVEDGKPRRAMLDIALTEPKPGGGFYSYTIPRNVMLDPLYDVTIKPLQFRLSSDCATFGDSQIQFQWVSPDGKYHSTNFGTSQGKTVNIPQFAWAQQGVSASANLHLPVFQFVDTDDFTVGGASSGVYLTSPPQSYFNLVPIDTRFFPSSMPSATGVTTGLFTTRLAEANHRSSCDAAMEYIITYQLRWYPYL